MKQSRIKSTLINTSFAVISRIVSMLMGFVQKTIFIRTLGMSYVGISGLFTDILMVLSLAELGIGSAIAYSLYKPIAENDYKKIAQLMNFFKKAYIYISGLIFVVGLCLMPFIDYIVKDVPDISEDIKCIFILYIINTCVTYLLVYRNTLLVAAQKQYIVSNVQTVFTIITVIVQCITLLVLKNFIVYLVLQIAFSLMQNITINYIASKNYPELKKYAKENISKEDRKKLFTDVKALMMYKIANVITTGTDSTIISASLGTSQVGVLGNYRTIRGYVTSMIAQFYNAINPSLGNLAATEGRQRQYEIFQKLSFGTFWLTAFCSTSFFVLFNPFIKIWLGNEKWLLPTFTVAIYVTEYFFTTMIGPVGAFRQANGLFVQTKYLALIEAILNLIISIIFVRYLGIMGVLLGTVLSELLTTVWYEAMVIYKYIFKRSVLNYYLTLTGYYVVTVLCCVCITIIVQLLPDLGIIVDFIIRILLCVIIPNTVIWLLFRKKDQYMECKKLIVGIAKSLIAKVSRR